MKDGVSYKEDPNFISTLRIAVEQGYIISSNSHYELTQQGLKALLKHSIRGPDESKNDTSAADKPSRNGHSEIEEQKAIIITGNPEFIIPSHTDNIEAIRKKKLESLGYRTLQLLGELELVGGRITDLHPATHLYRQTNDETMDVTTFNRLVPRLIKLQLILVTEEEDGRKTIQLTELGREYISQLKSSPDIIEIATPPAEHLWASKSFFIIEYLLENSAYIDQDGVHWYMPKNHQHPIVSSVALEVDLSHESLIRRLYELRTRKKYLVAEHDETQVNSNQSQITNLGVTKEGIDFFNRVVDKLKKESNIIDDEVLEEIMSLTLTALELAEATNNQSLARKLKERNSRSWVYELNPVALEEHVFWLERNIDRLRNDYLFEYSP